MVTINDIAMLIEHRAPLSLCSEGDNAGLIVGRRNAEVTCVLTALDLDSDTVDHAIAERAQLVVCHHPPIYYPPLMAVNDDTCPLILRLIENDIAVYAAHTNLDWAQGGVCDLLCEFVGMTNIKPLVGNEGRVGEIEPAAMSRILETIKEQLQNSIKYVGDPERIINKVGVVSGSGGDWLEAAQKQGCDLFISADFKYHQAQFAYEKGICIIDAGHFETENPIIYLLAKWIKEEYNGLRVITSNRKYSYYRYF